MEKPRIRIRAGRAHGAAATLPVFRAPQPAFEAASVSGRGRFWRPSNLGATAAVVGSVETLRARARDLDRKNPFAKNAQDTWAANCIGTGITPRSLIGDPVLKAEAQELWEDFVQQSDADGITTFYGQQELAFNSMFGGGECFARLRPRRLTDDLTVPMQVQLIEPDQVPVARTRVESNGNVTRNGIEFNRLGRRVAYHILPQHPGDQLPFTVVNEPVRVPARNVVHLYKPRRVGQIRGEPWLTQVIILLSEVDKWTDARLVREQVQAMFAGFITKKAEGASPLAGAQVDPTADETDLVTLEPGTLQHLEMGEEITFSDPKGTAASDKEFSQFLLRAVAIGTGLTYEMLTGDLTGVNFSSIRAGLLEFRRRCETLQHNIFIFQFCRPIYIEVMRQAVLAGRFGLLSDRETTLRELVRARWVPQGWRWVDPQNEIKAVVLAIRAGLLARRQAVQEMGYDIEEIDRMMAEDNARADTLGLEYDSDGRRATQNGGRKSDQTGTDETADEEPSEDDEDTRDEDSADDDDPQDGEEREAA